MYADDCLKHYVDDRLPAGAEGRRQVCIWFDI